MFRCYDESKLVWIRKSNEEQTEDVRLYNNIVEQHLTEGSAIYNSTGGLQRVKAVKLKGRSLVVEIRAKRAGFRVCGYYVLRIRGIASSY